MSHGSSIVSQVVCVLCADKLDQPTSRINVCGRSAFPVETEIRKLPISIYISEETRICVPCLRKLKKRKSLEENLEATTKDLVGTYNSSSASFNSVLPNFTEFLPSYVSTPAKPKATATCTSLQTPASQTTTVPTEPKQVEPGVTVSWFIICPCLSFEIFR